MKLKPPKKCPQCDEAGLLFVVEAWEFSGARGWQLGCANCGYWANVSVGRGSAKAIKTKGKKKP